MRSLTQKGHKNLQHRFGKLYWCVKSPNWVLLVSCVIGDKRLLSSDGTSSTDVMTVQYDGQTSDTETRFRQIYANDFASIQQPRLTPVDESEMVNKTEEDDNKGWNVVERKAKKVRFTKHTKSLAG